ncbi:MAG: FYDLN acid domain-containing protein [Solobacterium sp.]|nr:FYDLN acid domain-containing protein [Solobacterium sp.]
MYYVPDGTRICGFYECRKCSNRFLDLRTAAKIVCPYCGEEPDMEIGPDDAAAEPAEDAYLLKIIEGDDVAKYDALLSLAVTGGNYEWI